MNAVGKRLRRTRRGAWPLLGQHSTADDGTGLSLDVPYEGFVQPVLNTVSRLVVFSSGIRSVSPLSKRDIRTHGRPASGRGFRLRRSASLSVALGSYELKPTSVWFSAERNDEEEAAMTWAMS